MTTLDTRHPRSRIRIAYDPDFATVCERCKRTQPLAKCVEGGEHPGFPPHVVSGCLMCNHDVGFAAEPSSPGVTGAL